jgi:ribosomal protein L14E/L6E/L27E
LFTTGQIVYSKCGRDKGRPFIVFSFEHEYAFLADGDLRPIERQKKKKAKHIQITNRIDSDIKNKIENSLTINNADVRKALSAHRLN